MTGGWMITKILQPAHSRSPIAKYGHLLFITSGRVS